MRHETGEKFGESQLHIIQARKHVTVKEVRAQSSFREKRITLLISFYLCKHDITESNAVQTTMFLIGQCNKYHSIKILKNCVFSKEWQSSLCKAFTVWKASSTRYSVVWKSNSYKIPSVVNGWRMEFKCGKSHFSITTWDKLQTDK